MTARTSTAVRSGLAVALCLMPWIRERMLLPLWAAGGLAAAVYHQAVRKELKWLAKTLPVSELLGLLRRQYVRGMRKCYGDSLDVLPLAPKVVGPYVRGATTATIKWLVTPHPELSVERYEVQVRPADASESEWAQAATEVEQPMRVLSELTPDTEYAVRVRASNSKGSSDWCSGALRTKQEPVEGGGTGPGYRWTQAGKKLDELTVLIALPAGTKGKQLSVLVKPSHISIVLQPPGGERRSLLEGELWQPVQHEDIEWQLDDAPGSGGSKELRLLLSKQTAHGPCWPCLVRGHPEVEVAGIDKQSVDQAELMEKLQGLGLSPMGGGGPEGMMGGPMSMGMM